MTDSQTANDALRARLLSEDEFEDESFSGGALPGLDLRKKRFSGCRFSAMSVNEAQLQACVLDDCSFERCDLSMAQLADCSFRGVRFENTKLMGVDWTVARDLLFDVSFEECVLSYGVFVKRKMRQTKIIRCVAHEADFSGADLTEADFSGTDLRDARFSRTVLVKTNLASATHYHIRPADNRLKQTRFSMEAGLHTLAELGIVV